MSLVAMYRTEDGWRQFDSPQHEQNTREDGEVEVLTFVSVTSRSGSVGRRGSSQFHTGDRRGNWRRGSAALRSPSGTHQQQGDPRWRVRRN